MNSDTLNNNNSVSMLGRIIIAKQNVFNKEIKSFKKLQFSYNCCSLTAPLNQFTSSSKHFLSGKSISLHICKQNAFSMSTLLITKKNLVAPMHFFSCICTGAAKSQQFECLRNVHYSLENNFAIL